ncbi:hypothetical protein F441_11239 [Phytophthora nicotianae CJ01A1]|uniref:Uncharacterized protein n=4 Tax=Phytophthora nicotianae TaxID=4792 RepID=W2Q311_PHYN3|nr:hypothetical protein PPTG_23210 [Phytophthora nicotianae INRA-310]ETI43846.1 hypothetical protein F443_11318 [Phytophthora nicotianae P1569]ETN07583.1 hypothetical protein PPTG_23210 [Phytophthora nicotianae INRA-310]ETO72526.1 hypothetical protein F444_11385 [Phytophthora nicotianae P1976]ETP13664.1 hypothetical protein F441_11239 [Phytophthora nicotianae CJ01A1]
MASLGDDQAAAELLDEVDAELREQAAEESANVFVSIAGAASNNPRAFVK